MTADFRVVSHRGHYQALPLTSRAFAFRARSRSLSFLRFLRAAHEAGLVVG